MGQDVKQLATEKNFLAYFQGKKVLIVDPASAFRGPARKMLTQWGVKAADIKTADHFDEAKQLIAEHKPTLIFSEIVLKNESAFSLLKTVNEYCPKSMSRMFVVVSDKNSPALAAMAAEEDVDVFLIRPFNYSILEDEFLKAIAPKIQAPEYLEKVEFARQLIREGKHDEALKEIQSAKPLDPKPVLAMYFEGVAYRAQGKTTEARAAIENGLNLDPTHYKCLTGMYETQMDLKDFDGAYKTIKTLLQNHPVSPQKLPDLIRLFIVTKNYADLEDCYEFLSKLDSRDDTMTTNVAAGLVICGKHYLQQGAKDKAVAVLNKTSALANRKPKILSEVIKTLNGAGLTAEAEAILNKLPEDIKSAL